MILVAMTISKVRESNNPATTDNEQVWALSMKLSPEYLITATAVLSIILSLGISHSKFRLHSVRHGHVLGPKSV